MIKDNIIVSIWQPKATKWKKQGYTTVEKYIALAASLTALLVAYQMI